MFCTSIILPLADDEACDAYCLSLVLLCIRSSCMEIDDLQPLEPGCHNQACFVSVGEFRGPDLLAATSLWLHRLRWKDDVASDGGPRLLQGQCL